MEWRAKTRASEGRISPADVKVCELCGALNHDKNMECFTCGWRGQFGRDKHTISLAWHRLTDQCEGVHLEQLTARPTYFLDELGQRKHRSLWQRLVSRCRHWWQGFLADRDRQAARREQAHRRRRIMPGSDSALR
jgi:hypothetical protein